MKIDRPRQCTTIGHAVKASVAVAAIVTATVFLYVLFGQRAVSRPPAVSNDRGNQLLASKKDAPYIHSHQPRSQHNASRLEDRALKDPNDKSPTIGQDGGGVVRRPGPSTSRSEVVPPIAVNGEFTGNDQIPVNHKYGGGVSTGHGNGENKTSQTIIRYGHSVCDYEQTKDVPLRPVPPRSR